MMATEPGSAADDESRGDLPEGERPMAVVIPHQSEEIAAGGQPQGPSRVVLRLPWMLMP